MSGVFFSLRRREEGGGVWVPFLNDGWRLSLIFVTVPIYLGKREALQSEVRKHCTFLFSSCRCTVKCILNAGRNTKKGCHGDKICQGKQHAILKMNKSINVKAIFFFPK